MALALAVILLANRAGSTTPTTPGLSEVITGDATTGEGSCHAATVGSAC